MRINKLPLIKGGICGIALSCLNNFFIILSLYWNFPNYIFYGIAIISAILAFTFFINDKILNFLYIFFVSIFAFVITEFVISLTGIVNIVFKHINGASEEMWAGDGFGMLVILLFILTGYFVGSILAFIFTMIKKFINNKRVSSEKT